MMHIPNKTFSSIVAGVLFTVFAQISLAQTSTREGVYTEAQAIAGGALYLRSCVECHGITLAGGEGGPGLVGGEFWNQWQDQSLAAFYQITASTMPVNNPNGFSAEQYADLVAFMLQQNGLPAGEQNLPSSAGDLVAITMQPSLSPVRVASLMNGASTAQRVIEYEWLGYHNDTHATRYAPLDQINADNVQNLEVAWRWTTLNHGPNPEFNYESTPVMADGVLYATAGRRRDVVAIDPVTGENLWMYRFDEGGRRGPRVNSGRGVSYWREGDQSRVVVVTPGYYLISLDTATGKPDPDFGDNGMVDLRVGQEDRFEIDIEDIPSGLTAPPVIVDGVIVIGAAFPSGGSPRSMTGPAGNIRGYDMRTGERLWIFHTIPQEGEFGTETWRNNSNTFTGNAGSWATMSADQDRGIVYVPVEAATGDMYGGHRPGDNLFSQSLVALNARTGERIWHYQLIHHDIWDYDPPTAPVLADLNVDGEIIPAAIQVSKQGMVYTLNRLTGEPVWPIEERAVPQSTIPGEQTSPTQPFPTKPAPFERLGMSEDDLLDWTPEIKAEAIRLLNEYTYGPVFTPTSMTTETNKGTLFMPGFGGGANWQGVAFDPETNMLYIPSTSHPMSIGLTQDSFFEDSDFDYAMARGGFGVQGPFGLPLIKPPYGRITAIDMNAGEHEWMMANADTPDEIKNHPRLRGVDIPLRTGHGDRGGLLVTKSLLFAGEGAGLYGGQTGGGNKFRAHDKATGEIIAEFQLPAKQTGLPMTYQIDGVQYIVVPIGDRGFVGELVALRVAE
ncbi:MAG: pyrroloquinoline quinone-dependent dehydrogenase [Gammaproteobacteria bacterium]|jgi:quinoprotein glucose dehydrogenase|nr:pyrroloquinoline quinone-dependent dehydrogenase [Gammaproteobacteria bacterium]